MKCRKCGTCCKTKIGPFVFPDDVPEVCDFLKIKPNIFLKEYCMNITYKYIYIIYILVYLYILNQIIINNKI